MAREIKGVVFDVDGTLILENSWQKLNLALGVPPEIDQRLFEEYHVEGKFSYQEWIDRIVVVYNSGGPVHRSKIERILKEYTLAHGARDVSLALQVRHYHVGVVSGGLDAVVCEVAKDIKVKPNYAFANSSIEYDKNGHLSKIVARGADYEVKLASLKHLCELWGIRLEECLCVGDSYADQPLFEATGNGVTFTHQRCSMLHDSCWRQISELTELLDLL